ncbi:MAG: M48 family metalloprotease [Desulfovibrio sp.]|nr:M48 family metalloprotease [Desulfovibrio sp.]
MGSRLRQVLLALLLTITCLSVPVEVYAFFFGGVTIKDEKEMGRKFDATIRAKLPVIDDPEVSLYVESLLTRLVKTLPPQPFTFKSTVILNNTMNAFAVPGGYVYILTGLIMRFESEAQLAGVLAHELAHVTQRHVASRLERAQYTTFGSLLLAVAGVVLGGPGGGALAVGAMGAGQSAMLNYSRMDESEADQIGLQYICKAGLDPKGMVEAFKVLRQKSRMSGSNIPTYLSTHPAIGDRITGLSARIEHLPREIKLRKGDNTRFLRVQTLLWARYGDAQAALQRFSQNDALSLMGRGIVLARQNSVAKAQEAFSQALAAAPSDSLILREAGAFHYRKGNLRESEILLRRALAITPSDYMASFYLARLLADSGDSAKAIDYFREVLRKVPEESEVHQAYARALNGQGQTARAFVHMTLAAIYAGDKKKAEQYFNKAKGLARNSEDKRKVDQLEKVYTEYKTLWKR